MLHEKIKERGLLLAVEQSDPYVKDLRGFIKRGGNRMQRLVDDLLFAAMIEARSCERFKILSTQLTDDDLRAFYRSLMESEANHYTVFLGFARQYGGRAAVDARWEEFLDYEAKLMETYGKTQTMHG